eukprot:scaffold1741_cov102-Isochrysis_galbana.AAC.2
MGARQALAQAASASTGEALLAEAAKEDGAVKTASGLVYSELLAGDGASPGPSAQVGGALGCLYRRGRVASPGSGGRVGMFHFRLRTLCTCFIFICGRLRVPCPTCMWALYPTPSHSPLRPRGHLHRSSHPLRPLPTPVLTPAPPPSVYLCR